MGCVVCGSPARTGSLLCSKCFGRLGEPISLVPRLADPNADQRLVPVRSATMMIGPLVSPEVKFSKGTEPALTFRTMLTGEDRSQIPAYVDMYLDQVGIPLQLTGFERVPRRELISSMVWNCESLEFDTEFWAKACIRVGNIYALSAERVNYLAIAEKDRKDLRERHAALARKFYSRSDKFPELARVARGNMALLAHWMGERGQALSELDAIIAEPGLDDPSPYLIKRSIVLIESGQRDAAAETLRKVAEGKGGPLAKNILSSLEAVQ